jgi:hypothetical protein
MSTPELKQRLNQLPDTYRSYVLSDLPRVISDTFAEANGFDELKAVTLESGFALYLLFFLDKTGFADFIVTECGLDAKTAAVLVAGMHQALRDDARSFHEETAALVFAQAPESAPLDIASEIAALEKTPEVVSSIRTMNSDSKQIGYSSVEENTYTSTQNALINESK